MSRPRMKSLALLAAAGLAAAVVPQAARAATSGPLPPVDDLVRYFETIVFGSEMGPKHATNVVAKWSQPAISLSLEPHAKLDAQATERFLGMVKAHLGQLARLTGKKFGGVHDPKEADIRVLFVRRADMGKINGPNIDAEAVRKAAAEGGCYYLSWRQPESDIVKAVIVVNAERDPAETNSCLLEELTQSLGLFNDSDALRPSIFSDRDRLTELAPQDALMVRTLYDPRMKPGLPKAEALQVARAIIAELVRSAPAR